MTLIQHHRSSGTRVYTHASKWRQQKQKVSTAVSDPPASWLMQVGTIDAGNMLYEDARLGAMHACGQLSWLDQSSPNAQFG
jgi:hypothetical protein